LGWSNYSVLAIGNNLALTFKVKLRRVDSVELLMGLCLKATGCHLSY